MLCVTDVIKRTKLLIKRLLYFMLQKLIYIPNFKLIQFIDLESLMKIVVVHTLGVIHCGRASELSIQ